jgi:hypothetical protein
MLSFMKKVIHVEINIDCVEHFQKYWQPEAGSNSAETVEIG